jgi:hypothetical protein
MGEVILLAIGSAVFPMLLAGVAVLLSRKNPARLLVAFWLGGFTVSMVAGIVIIRAFGEAAASLGSDGQNLSPTTMIIAGAVALGLAWLLGTSRGHAVLESWREHRPHRHKDKDKPEKKPWAERVLSDSGVPVAAAAGAILNLPGPFYLIALGHMASSHYSFVGELAAILMFNLIMLILVEAPMVGYAINPEKTDTMVSKLSAWLNRNGLKIIAALAGIWGISLIAKGVHDLLT